MTSQPTPAFHYEFWLREDGGFYHLIPLLFLTRGTSGVYVYTLIIASEVVRHPRLWEMQPVSVMNELCPMQSSVLIFRLFSSCLNVVTKKLDSVCFRSPYCTIHRPKKRKEQTIKNSLELSASFIKKSFHVSIS